MPDDTKTDSYTEFVSALEVKLRHSLTAAFGPEVAREAVAEALAYGWEHWGRVQRMENAAGYLYRVGHNYAKRTRARRRVSFPESPIERVPWVEPGLPQVLGQLTEKQRIAVYLVFGHDWSISEVAQVLGVAPTTVKKHLERGMRKLREGLGVEV